MTPSDLHARQRIPAWDQEEVAWIPRHNGYGEMAVIRLFGESGEIRRRQRLAAAWLTSITSQARRPLDCRRRPSMTWTRLPWPAFRAVSGHNYREGPVRSIDSVHSAVQIGLVLTIGAATELLTNELALLDGDSRPDRPLIELVGRSDVY